MTAKFVVVNLVEFHLTKKMFQIQPFSSINKINVYVIRAKMLT